MTRYLSHLARAVLVVPLWLARSASAFAHCDTMEGPVVVDARKALASGRPDDVLKWVGPEAEAEVRNAFATTLKVRSLSSEARDLAERYFFETVVRLHRAGEGEPFTGLSSGIEVKPIIDAANGALALADATVLVTRLNSDIDKEVRARLALAVRARAHKDDSVAAGREFVEAYVSYVHYVETVDVAANAPTAQKHGLHGVPE